MWNAWWLRARAGLNEVLLMSNVGGLRTSRRTRARAVKIVLFQAHSHQVLMNVGSGEKSLVQALLTERW